MKDNRKYKHIPFAIVLIAIGALLLIRNLGILPFQISNYLISWPMIFVVIGVFTLLKGKIAKSILFFSLGGYFLLPSFGLYQPPIEKIWPVFLILGGIALLFKKPKHERYKDMNCNNWKGMKWENNHSTISTDMDATAILGGASRQFNSAEYKGANLTAIMGGLEIDLTECHLSEEGAVLEVSIVMGGIELIIPRHWNVRNSVTPILGGLEDKNASVDNNTIPKIIIQGTIVMGGLEIIRK